MKKKMRPLFIRTTLNTTLHFFWFPSGYMSNFSFSCKKSINRQTCIKRLLRSVFKLINCILTIYSITPLSILNFLFSITTRFIASQWQTNPSLAYLFSFSSSFSLFSVPFLCFETKSNLSITHLFLHQILQFF